MGSLSQFICRRCGYEAEVSGEPDSGLACHTVTIQCLTCQELYDVVDGEWDAESGFKPKKVRCPKATRHRWQEWTDPGPCPKCGEPMERGEITVLWD